MTYLQFESVSTERDIIHAKPAPSIEWHLTKDKEQFDLLTVSVGVNEYRDSSYFIEISMHHISNDILLSLIIFKIWLQ